MSTANCLWCHEGINDGDPEFERSGLHHDCLVRAVAGGLHHQIGGCACCGGHLPPDPPSLTRREAARVASMHYRRRMRSGVSTP